MKFHGKITVLRFAEDNFIPESTVIHAESFHAKSIQSAKAALTKLSNETELFSWVQSWDNETRIYTGTDLRWRNWANPPAHYKQDNGVEVAFSRRLSERESGETIYPAEWGKYGKSVQYQIELSLFWKKPHPEKE